MPTRSKPLRIGITGGIGSGKTLASSFFEKLGYPVIHADNIAKQLYKTNPRLKNQLVSAFGKNILNEKGNIEGAGARKIILASKKNISRVNKIVHPFVIKEIENRIKRLKSKIVFVEAAIMFETGNYRRNDFNILIYANKTARKRRIRERDNITALQAERLISLQMPESEKIKMADFIIKNNGTKKELFDTIKRFTGILKLL